MLGVCSEGLIVYEDEIETKIFLWPRVLKISYKRSTFLLKMRPSEVFIHFTLHNQFLYFMHRPMLVLCYHSVHSFDVVTNSGVLSGLYGVHFSM